MSICDVALKIGRIIWIDRVLTEKDELLIPTTALPTESYNYIIKDLEEPVQDLPTAKIAGRANRYLDNILVSSLHWRCNVKFPCRFIPIIVGYILILLFGSIISLYFSDALILMKFISLD